VAEPPPASAEEPRVAPLRILVAEDNLINQTLIDRLLHKHQHTVVIADDGRQAVEAYRRQTFDVVLMDVSMPEMDGFAATAAIRAIERATGRRTPVVAMTAHAMKGDRERCLEHDMDAYLSKPVAAVDLWRTLAALFPPAVATGGDEPGGSPEEALVDRQAAMACVGGDLNLLAALVNMFRDEVPRMREQVRQALARQDSVAVRRLAHTFKSVLGNLGARPVAAVAGELERLGKSADLAGAPEVWGRLEHALDRLDAQLELLTRS
jgi:CheY-like chemotaxis protein